MSGAFREPALSYAFLLMDQFKDAPEWWECCYAENGRYDKVADQQRYSTEDDSCKKAHPPAFSSKIVFCFNYDRMKYSDYEKGRKTYDDACEIHIS